MYLNFKNHYVIVPLSIISLILASMLFTSLTSAELNLLVYVATDKKVYNQGNIGEMVNIAGNVTLDGELVQTGLIAIEIDGPTKILGIWTLPLSTYPGQYYIEIVNLFVCDENRQPLSCVEKGEQVYAYMEVANHGIYDKQLTFVITLVDKNHVPITPTRISTLTVKAGYSSVYNPLLGRIPDWAATGTAYLYCGVYSSLPRNGGYPVCVGEEYPLDIVTSSSTSPITEASSQNGTYNLNIRLPKVSEFEIGNYTVYAVAYSQGRIGSSSTTFSTKLLGDVDENGVVDIFDVTYVCILYEKTPEDPEWDPKCDLNQDNIIDIYDLVMVCVNYGASTT